MTSPINTLTTTEFDEMYGRYNAAFEARDVDGFMSFYREDATKIDASGDVQWSREQIAGLFTAVFQMDFTSRFEPVKQVVTEHTALVVLDSTMTFPEFEEHFLTALTFTKDEGEWKVVSAASTAFPS